MGEEITSTPNRMAGCRPTPSVGRLRENPESRLLCPVDIRDYEQWSCDPSECMCA